MEGKLQTSFIPKKPLVEASGRKTAGVSVLFLIALIMFLGAILLSGGVFLYKRLLAKSIESKAAQLEIARNQFEPKTLAEYKALNNRIEAGKALLEGHVALSTIFQTLENITLQSVRFQDFRLERLSEETLEVTMKGQAKSYGSVALQSDKFTESGFFKDAIFSDLTLDPTGRVVFSVTAKIPSRQVLYSAAVEVPEAPPTPAATTT